MLPLRLAAPCPTKKRQRGVNVVDLMMWLVVASILLAAALQGVGYYQQAASLQTLKSDAMGGGTSVTAAAAQLGGTIDSKAFTTGLSNTSWSKGVYHDVEAPADGSSTTPFLRVATDASASNDVVYLFASCGSLGPGMNVVPKSGDVSGCVGPSPWVGGGRYAYSLSAGLTLVEQPGGGDWISSAISGDGTKMVAGQYMGSISTSTDSGNTWTVQQSSGAQPWLSLAISDDGKTILASGGSNLWLSHDGGATWTQSIASQGGAWRGVAVSDNGTRMTAADNGGYVWTSADSGTTWTRQDASGKGGWYAIASSADGSVIAAAQYYGYVAVSKDGGATWTKSTSVGTLAFTGIAISADGTKIVTGDNSSSGSVYVSSDSGATWTTATGAGKGKWRNFAVSADGSRVFAGQSGGDLYTSKDGGTTWIDNTKAGTGNWDSYAISDDGTKIIVAQGGVGGLFVGTYAY